MKKKKRDLRVVNRYKRKIKNFEKSYGEAK
jgi:hypothetical protein